MKRKISQLFLSGLCLYLVSFAVLAAERLIPVGTVVGLELFSDTVSIVSFDDTIDSARRSGLQIGDEIISIDSRAVHSAEDVRQALAQSDGSVDLVVLRKGKERQIHIEPEITVNGPRLGVYLRQGITGIGTVTYYDPDTGCFGTLGHSVTGSNGISLDFSRGNAYEASVVSVEKGRAGHPGQLKGALSGSQKLGTLLQNTSSGVFGSVSSPWQGEALPVASWEEITTGEATIRSTVGSTGPQDYSVEILKIYPQNQANGRNLLIRVTDPQLLQTTGGIVQGMSGSPIIQDGKLIGAVTHVLVNSPDTGYGIFIGNMLEAAG